MTSSWPFSLFTTVSLKLLLDIVSLMVWLIRPKSRKLSFVGSFLDHQPLYFLAPHLFWKIPDWLKWLSMSFSKQHVQRSSCDILSKDICWRLTDFVLISFLGKMEMIGVFLLFFFYIESFSAGSQILMRCEMDVHCKLYIIGHQKAMAMECISHS